MESMEETIRDTNYKKKSIQSFDDDGLFLEGNQTNSKIKVIINADHETLIPNADSKGKERQNQQTFSDRNQLLFSIWRFSKSNNNWAILFR